VPALVTLTERRVPEHLKAPYVQAVLALSDRVGRQHPAREVNVCFHRDRPNDALIVVQRAASEGFDSGRDRPLQPIVLEVRASPQPESTIAAGRYSMVSSTERMLARSALLSVSAVRVPAEHRADYLAACTDAESRALEIDGLNRTSLIEDVSQPGRFARLTFFRDLATFQAGEAALTQLLLDHPNGTVVGAWAGAITHRWDASRTADQAAAELLPQ
jgi:hypothetical protein